MSDVNNKNLYRREGIDKNSIAQNPFFVSPIKNCFALQKFSPCIDAGTEVYLTKDLAGNNVPFGIAVDIGAFEFGSGKTNYGIYRDGVFWLDTNWDQSADIVRAFGNNGDIPVTGNWKK